VRGELNSISWEGNMKKNNSTSMIVLIATLAAAVATADAQQQSQNQNANQQQNQQAQQPQQAQPSQTPTNQPVPQQKKSVWQKLRDASQAGQNAIQQGSNTVQQGSSTIQQTGQQVQGGMQQIPNGMQQGANGAQGTATGFQSSGGTGACGSSCFDAGSFQANVSQMTTSQEGAWHVIRMTIQFHNSTNQPLIIAYHDGSMVMVDNNGNTYIPAGGNPGQLQGMGIDRGAQTDSQFQLGPGQTGSALFSVARNRPNTSPIGTAYSYNLSIDELQLQNGALALAVRTYNLNFPSLVPGTSNAAFSSGSAPANGFVGNNGGSTNAVPAVPQGSAQNVAGQGQNGVAAQQQRMVNGKPVTTAPAQTTASPAVNTAATKTPVAATSHPVTPATAAKPVAVTTTAKPATTTPAKKVPPPPTTTTK
jgi:hypothetical protein